MGTYMIEVLCIFLGTLVCSWLMSIIIIVFCKSFSFERFSCF